MRHVDAHTRRAADRWINGTGTSIADVVDALSGLPPIIVQAMFVADTARHVDNTTEGAVSEWLAALERIRPAQVHIYTIDRAPALCSLRPVESQRRKEIAGQVHAAGFRADVFPSRERCDGISLTRRLPARAAIRREDELPDLG